MLSEEFRLKKKRDFEIILENGQFVGGALATLKCWSVNPEKYPKRGYSPTDLKIGFVVGLKISKKAVVRNRLKRQMREVVRLLLQENRIPRGFMLIFFAKKEMIGSEFQDIAKDMQRLLTRLHLLKK